MFKKIITFALVLALCAGMISAFALTSSAAEYDGGTGTPVDPYIISSEASLKALAEAVNGGETYAGVYFELGNDITLTSDWTPIGLFNDSADGSVNLTFNGSFNGKGYEIKDLNIESDEYASIGLFGNLGIGAVVKNVSVSGNITGTGEHIGSIAAVTLMSTIQNCVSNVVIDAKSNGNLPFIGGIVGNARDMSKVEYCVNNGNITMAAIEAAEGITPPGAVLVAGIAGQIEGMTNVKYCINEADLEVKNAGTGYVGGIVSRVAGSALEPEGSVVNCVIKGNLTANDGVNTGCIGGVISYLYVKGYTIDNCGVIGTISTPEVDGVMATTYLGYLVGNSKNPATIKNCKVSGDVLLGKNSGGNNTPLDCITGVTEIDSLEFAVEDAIKAWAKADAEAIVTMPAETTTEEPADTPEEPTDTTTEEPADNTTKPADVTPTQKPTGNTTTKPNDTDTGKKGCGGFAFAQAIAIFVSVAGAAVVIKKKN